MTVPALETELDSERAHLAASRAALRRMRERAEALFATGDGVAGDAYSAETLGRTLSRRVAELADNPNTPLFFGRLDFTTDERYHVGRRHVTDDSGEPMVLDWRAPISRAFYRASAGDPQDVAVRRRFGFSGGELTSFEDEHLDRGEELGTASRILTAEIERPRVGPMRDIVATIQPEQDELVRAELDESICVQGAPGTGKTAVGLHRAAYLLYLHRERLRRAGVLIVGPNRAFLHYIAAVLPALGEVDVTQTTVDDLVARVPVRAVDTPEAAAVKQDARMAAVLATALHGRIREPGGPLMVPDGSYRWRISTDALRRIVGEVRGEAPPYGIGRERVRARVVALLVRQAEHTSGESPGETWQRRMGKAKPVTEFLDAVWPAVTPEQLVFDVLCAPSDELLSEAERDAIRWAKPPRTARSARWTAADAVLIDEAAGLVDRVPSFGHVVIDEAQDLSPMQCRAIARRSEHGSITLLGDLAQGTAPWAARDWRETLAHLGKPDARVVPLRTGFRVPEVVLELANRLLPALGVDVPEAVSLRRDGALRVREVADLETATVAAVREACDVDGSVGVIAADATVPRLAAALSAAGVDAGGPDDDERVTVMPASLAKGLEYDHVIVVEPADIVAAEPRGLHRLYVVLTRAVSRLDVLHHASLPAAVTGCVHDEEIHGSRSTHGI
ncbi:HelD family protein [Planosporangium mesophilum]|uniref:DNA helicase n=1 Tax=Planosporangium mesophilum TaxID=689768 RepID=A0A8J3TG86_9ACTN|nr:AAA family ATPase [Planosporangium mesophilum]GII26378.1 DNA helicase [Planosporangium mesophilum]